MNLKYIRAGVLSAAFCFSGDICAMKKFVLADKATQSLELVSNQMTSLKEVFDRMSPDELGIRWKTFLKRYIAKQQNDLSQLQNRIKSLQDKEVEIQREIKRQIMLDPINIAINNMVGNEFEILKYDPLCRRIFKELCEINMKEDTSINERNLCKDILKVFLLDDKTIIAKLNSKINDTEIDKIKKIKDAFAEHVREHFLLTAVESADLVFLKDYKEYISEFIEKNDFMFLKSKNRWLEIVLQGAEGIVGKSNNVTNVACKISQNDLMEVQTKEVRFVSFVFKGMNLIKDSLDIMPASAVPAAPENTLAPEELDWTRKMLQRDGLGIWGTIFPHDPLCKYKLHKEIALRLLKECDAKKRLEYWNSMKALNKVFFLKSLDNIFMNMSALTDDKSCLMDVFLCSLGKGIVQNSIDHLGKLNGVLNKQKDAIESVENAYVRDKLMTDLDNAIRMQQIIKQTMIEVKRNSKGVKFYEVKEDEQYERYLKNMC